MVDTSFFFFSFVYFSDILFFPSSTCTKQITTSSPTLAVFSLFFSLYFSQFFHLLSVCGGVFVCMRFLWQLFSTVLVYLTILVHFFPIHIQYLRRKKEEEN